MLTNTFSDKALLVDLYELTMGAAYFDLGMDFQASFELFVRQLPANRSFLLAAGVEDSLDYLASLHFSEEDIRFLRSLPAMRTISPGFFDYLRHFRFTGDVEAVDEGEVVFGEEPVLQVTAPVVEAQIAETFLLSVVNFETLVASKAARVYHAARGKGVLEFGTRRAQGPEAGLRAARAAFIGGCVATSNVLAGALYGIPLAGTAAHSWTQAFSSERESFVALLRIFPESAILLIDTYDALAGAATAASLPGKVPGVRLDSGDLLEKSRQVREILDQHGHGETKIVATGDLNEFKVDALVSAGAPIDFFGVGTELATSRDLPALNVVYKMVETAHDGAVEFKTKFSEDKEYYPGRKQVFRVTGERGFEYDLIATRGEKCLDARPLLKPAMRDGKRQFPTPPIAEIRERALRNLSGLPARIHALDGQAEYPVRKSAGLERLRTEVRAQYLQRGQGVAVPAES
jgi:nicotinate phosphoribosyltransferase